MYRVSLIAHLCLLISIVSTSDELTNALDSVLNSPYQKFMNVLQSMKESLLDDNIIDENIEDIVRYSFGLMNEDKYLNSTQLIRKYGYPVEEYEVETPDGYKDSLVRIPGPGKPVLLIHGFMSSSDVFLTSQPGNALAYILSDAGYDVWMGNTRGNKYSRKHARISPNDKKFWDFSFHEVGMHDLPTFIDFILKTSCVKKLYLVGYSQGATESLVLFSEKPEYNDKIILLILMAPVAWMTHIKSPVLQALALLEDAVFLSTVFGEYEFLSNDSFLALIRELLCGTSVTAGLLCNSVIATLVGFNIAQVNFTLYPVQLAHEPNGGSIKQFLHYLQEIQSAKAMILYSTNDWMADPIDVHKLASRLPNLVSYHRVSTSFNHLDFAWGKDAKKLVYNKILDLFHQYQC